MVVAQLTIGYVKVTAGQVECYSCPFFPSQVHACNILRSLYRDTKLGEGVFPFVSDGVIVAIDGFLSESWAVSNFF